MIFALVLISVGLLFLAGLVGGIIWLYRKFITKDPHPAPFFSTAPLLFPAHFNWALLLLLLGFHVGLYSFVTYAGPESRIPAAGLAVFTALASSVWFFLLAKKRSIFLYCMIVAGALSGFWLFWRANGFVQTWDFIFFALIQIILYVWFVKDNLPGSLGSWLGTVLSLLPISIAQGLRVLTSLLKRETTSKASFLGWLKTAIITLLVLAVFLGLLSQADPVFAEIVKDFRSQLVGRALWSIVLVFLASAWWTLSLQQDAEETETKAHWLSYRDIVSVLGVVVIVVGIFLAVQFKYLFGGSRELLNTLDLTFSEYVRKGFTELLFAVFIGGLLSYIAGAKTRLWQSSARRTGQVLNLVMIVELGLLLLSALKRDLLYVDTYGLTRVRVVGGVFLVWLAFFLVVLLAYGWHRIKEKTALAVLWCGALLVLVSINVMNVDQIVGKGAPGHHDYTDYFYLMQLSEDAAGIWPQTLTGIEKDTATLISKSELSDADRAQLAGLKLGLLSFIENRDALYTKYAPADWLLQNNKLIGLELPNKSRAQQDGYSWSQYTPIIQAHFPSPTELTQNPQQADMVIPKSLQDYRSWEFSNIAERRAYDLMQAQGERTFALPEQLLSDILKYQIRQQVSLEKEENSLLRELKYQFITVELRRYWPAGLQPLEIRKTADLPPYVTDEFSSLEKSNQLAIPQLAALSCASPEVQAAQPIVVNGVIRRQMAIATNVMEQGLKIYDLGLLANVDLVDLTAGPAIQIETSQQLKFIDPSKEVSKDAVDYGKTPGGVMQPMQVQYSPDSYPSTETQLTFVKATVKPIAVTTDAGCTVHFSSDSITAYNSF